MAPTSQAAQPIGAALSEHPRGFPGLTRGWGRDPAPTTPNLGLKEGPDLTGETKAGTLQEGGGTQLTPLRASVQPLGSSEAQRGAGTAGVTQLGC